MDEFSREFGFYQDPDSFILNLSSLNENNPKDIFIAENLGPGKFIFKDKSTVLNTYYSRSSVQAAYISTDFMIGSVNFRTGLRAEHFLQTIYLQELNNINSLFQRSTNLLLLPSIHSKLEVRNKTSIKCAYFRSVYRPSSREVVPFNYYSYNFASGYIGNPNLKTGHADNLDIRLECNSAEIHLAYKDKAIFTIALQNISIPAFREFWYRFKSDEAWKLSNGSIEINEMGSGDYDLEIKVLSSEGFLIEKKIAKIIVAPPFWFSWAGILIFLLVAIGLTAIVVKFYTARLERKNVELDAVIKEKTKDLEETNEALNELAVGLRETASDLEEANQEISDSIRYASRIQMAILPTKKIPLRQFQSFELWFQPKDVLSGDFYWFSSNEKYCYIAAADCTGHGTWRFDECHGRKFLKFNHFIRCFCFTRSYSN